MRSAVTFVPCVLFLGCAGASAPTEGPSIPPSQETPASREEARAPRVALRVPRGVPVPEALEDAPPALREAFSRAAALASPLVSDEARCDADFAAWQAHVVEELAAIERDTEPLLADPRTDDGARVVRTMARTLVRRAWNERLPQRGRDRLPDALRYLATGGPCSAGPWQDACEEWQSEAEWALDVHEDEDALAARLRSLSLRTLPADPHGVVRVHIATFSAEAYGSLVDPSDGEIDAVLRDREAELRGSFETVRSERDAEGEAIAVSAILLDDDAFVPDAGQDEAEEGVSAEEAAARILRRLAAGERFEALARRHSSEPSSHAGGRHDWMRVAGLRAPFDALAHAPCRGEVHPQPVVVRQRAWVLRCDARVTPPVTFEQLARELARELLRREAGMAAARAEAERALASLRAGHSWQWVEDRVVHAWGARWDEDALPAPVFFRSSFVELTPEDARHPEAARRAFFASTEPFPEAVLEIDSSSFVFEREAFVREDAWSPDESTGEARLRLLLERAEGAIE